MSLRSSRNHESRHRRGPAGIGRRFGSGAPSSVPVLLSVCVLMATMILMLPSCARNDPEAIARVRAFRLEPFPDATVGEMVDAFYQDPVWSSRGNRLGSLHVKVSGTVMFQQRPSAAVLRFVVASNMTSIVPLSLTLDGAKLPDVITYQFLARMYHNLFPVSRLIVGDWVNDYPFRRSFRFVVGGTFRLVSWPWDLRGSYVLPAGRNIIVLHPSGSLRPELARVTLQYEFADDGSLVLTDPDADIFLLSKPLVFRRQPRPRLERLAPSNSEPAR